MTQLEIILSIFTALSGFGNIAQWVNLRAVRDKVGYEAENAHIENLKTVIELQAEEIKRLQERVQEQDERQRQLEEELAILKKHLHS